MTKEEILSRIEKLQHRWQFHAVEHREKRNNNSPSYNANEHGIAIGYLKALNTFSDWIRRLDTEKDLALTIEDLELIHTFLYAVKNNKHGTFTFTRLLDEQYQEVLRRFHKSKEGK